MKLEQTPKRFCVPKNKVTKELVREFYDWAMYKKAHPNSSMELLDKYIEPNKTVLILGCGSGADSLYFVRKGCKIVGVDISPKIIRFADERTKKFSGVMDFIVGDMGQLEDGELLFAKDYEKIDFLGNVAFQRRIFLIKR